MRSDTDTDELIRDALRLAAGRAPHPAAVTEALRAGRAPRTVRSTPLVLAAAALVVLAAIGIPLGLHLTAPRPVPRPAAAGPVSPVTRPGTPLRYGVTWVPAGYREKMRSLPADGRQSRTWMTADPDGDTPDDEVNLLVTAPTENFANTASLIATGPDKVSINGVPGAVSGNSPILNEAKVIWMPDPDTVLMVTVKGIANRRDTALRVARSVRPDGTSTVAPQLSLGYLPGGYQAGDYTVYGSAPADWTAETDAESGPSLLEVQWSTGTTLTGGTPVTVQGVPGHYLATASIYGRQSPQPALWARLDGRWLMVTMPAASESELLQIADGVKVVPGDQNWLRDN